MAKITFMGAGSSAFVRNVLGDCMLTEGLNDSEMALYDIDPDRLKDSVMILEAINNTHNNGKARLKAYCGTENRREALRGADFVVNAIQVGLYDPCTIIDFEVPKKYGIRQTIADTLGIGGIMRGLRTIPVLEGFAEDMRASCPGALFLNYTNPMAILSGYMQRFSGIKTIGLCHSVQVCSEHLLRGVGMEDRLEGRSELIAGINHMGWLLEIKDKDGNDLYPEIKERAAKKNAEQKHGDMVRFDYIKHFGYYCTESSEHNSEYNPFYIKSRYPELIGQFNIPLDEYPRRCVNAINGWKAEKERIIDTGKREHKRSGEYASYIMESILTGKLLKIGGNVLNSGLIENLPPEACVEVPCFIDNHGVNPCRVGRLPEHLAAMNRTNINVQLLTINAAITKKKEDVYHAAMLDPHTAAELSTADIVALCDELIAAHGSFMSMYK